jgi:hypothetical protein
MSALTDRINKFIISKQIKIGSRAEAEAYGIKLPPDFDSGTSKWEGDKTQEQQHAQATGERPDIGYKAPKTPKVPKVKAPIQPKTGMHYQKVPGTAIDEVAHQLTPKGPGYHSPEEIASDVRESQRLGHNFSNKVHGNKTAAPNAEE